MAKTALLLAFTAALALAASAQVTEKTFTLGASPHITVDNVNGPIHVVGDGGDQVRFTATESNPDNATDVHLNVTPSSDGLELYVDGPFRHDHHHWSNDEDDRDNRVRFSFELHVPSGAALDLSTVNDGDITVENIAGNFDVDNVNGPITLTGMSGAGRAYALNRPLKVTFRSNPRGDSYFGSLNAPVDLYFQAPLNANLKYKTFNGSVYSDFEVTPATNTEPVSESRHGGAIVFRRGGFTNGRIGSGGPTITLDGFNGNIYLRSEK
ncbi:MAG TPA: hypothetical protein VN709_04640 [Terriglobales bacterium]|nr:hypothetical protein [Terriglobales bacterium]